MIDDIARHLPYYSEMPYVDRMLVVGLGLLYLAFILANVLVVFVPSEFEEKMPWRIFIWPGLFVAALTGATVTYLNRVEDEQDNVATPVARGRSRRATDAMASDIPTAPVPYGWRRDIRSYDFSDRSES